MTADFVGNDRAVVEHQQRLHHRRPREHMHFPPQCLLDPCTGAQGALVTAGGRWQVRALGDAMTRRVARLRPPRVAWLWLWRLLAHGARGGEGGC